MLKKHREHRKITALEAKNANMRLEIDELAQYGRRYALRIHTDWKEPQ